MPTYVARAHISVRRKTTVRVLVIASSIDVTFVKRSKMDTTLNTQAGIQALVIRLEIVKIEGTRTDVIAEETAMATSAVRFSCVKLL